MCRVSVSRIILCFMLIIANGCTLASSSEPLYESDHPYLNFFENTWVIKESGAQQIRLHFKDLDLAKDEGLFPYDYDKLILLDKYYNELATYGSHLGFGKTDFWTDWYTGDTIIIKLITDNSGAGYGFKIDKIDFRTGMGKYENSLPESDHPYANNLEYMSPIYANGSTKIRIHFEDLNLAKDEGLFPCGYDKLIILDKYGKKLSIYGGYLGFKKNDFWTDWYTGDTFIVKLITDKSGTGYGFKIDKIDPREEKDNNNNIFPINTSNETIESVEVSEPSTREKPILETSPSQVYNVNNSYRIFTNDGNMSLLEMSLLEIQNPIFEHPFGAVSCIIIAISIILKIVKRE